MDKRLDCVVQDLLDTLIESMNAIDDCTDAIYKRTRDRSIWALCDYALTAQKNLAIAEEQLKAKGIDYETAHKMALKRAAAY